MRFAAFLLLVLAGNFAADISAQTDYIYIHPLPGDTRINEIRIGTELTLIGVGDIAETGAYLERDRKGYYEGPIQ